MNRCQNPDCEFVTASMYCSRRCANLVNAAKRTPKPNPCKACGEQAPYERRYCSTECRRSVKGKPSDLIPEQVEAKRLAYNLKMKEYMKKRYYARRSHYVGVLGGECVRCGSSDDLQFDHVDPNTKLFDVGRAFASRNEKDLASEVAKRQLLCGPHHLEKSVENGDLGGHNRIENPDHGTSARYTRLKCRCDLCRDWKSLYNRGLVGPRGELRPGVTQEQVDSVRDGRRRKVS